MPSTGFTEAALRRPENKLASQTRDAPSSKGDRSQTSDHIPGMDSETAAFRHQCSATSRIDSTSILRRFQSPGQPCQPSLQNHPVHRTLLRAQPPSPPRRFSRVLWAHRNTQSRHRSPTTPSKQRPSPQTRPQATPKDRLQITARLRFVDPLPTPSCSSNTANPPDQSAEQWLLSTGSIVRLWPAKCEPPARSSLFGPLVRRRVTRPWPRVKHPASSPCMSSTTPIIWRKRLRRSNLHPPSLGPNSGPPPGKYLLTKGLC